jgi:hypothetical protein
MVATSLALFTWAAKLEKASYLSLWVFSNKLNSFSMRIYPAYLLKINAYLIHGKKRL